ncbi:uncharacterized protein LOC121406999 [Lytechinus variegatus]|uniref:uncharacterized protein LOC121406999 n=1 Tax=Lytechinus variegatus TaxID=7654 RepID=UPI001BB0FE56|nr:uncharacterized protein LOC121406999 [Lytechinus variegatus]
MFRKMSPFPVIGVLLAVGVVKSAEATSEKTAIIALSIFIVIPALFLLTCCTALIFVCHYRHKIPIFKSFWSNAKKGAGTTGKTPTSSAPPPPYAPTNPMPPPAGNPSAPPGQNSPGSHENPIEVDEVVIPIKKE